MATRTRSAGCPPKPRIDDRPLLGDARAASLARLFGVLANGTRLRLLHALVRARERCVTDVAAELGMKPQAISNQLQRLSDRGIVASRRNGNHVLYRIADPCVPALLDSGLCLLEDAQEGPRR